MIPRFYPVVIFVLSILLAKDSSAWLMVGTKSTSSVSSSSLYYTKENSNNKIHQGINPLKIDEESSTATVGVPETSRRHFVHGVFAGTSCSLLAVVAAPRAATADATTPNVIPASRAIGSGEYKCRQEGNCLEVGEWDGAVGWNWGGKDRCDANDPRCGPDGQLRDKPLEGKPVPRLVPTGSDGQLIIITHVVGLKVEIGRTGEIGVLKLGLYGNECPGSVQQLIDLCSEIGLSTQSVTAMQSSMGQVTAPVRLSTGGVISSITPGSIVEFGIPSQANAYGRSRGLAKTDDFVPQPRPDPSIVSKDQRSVRPHDIAGLLSVPVKGIGYGGTGYETEDEAFESSFLITASSSVSSLDKSRRVIGQILDPDSMAFLERLSTLPTKKGIRGVIPGQTSGPPLIKTVIRDVGVSKVTPPPSAPLSN